MIKFLSELENFKFFYCIYLFRMNDDLYFKIRN